MRCNQLDIKTIPAFPNLKELYCDDCVELKYIPNREKLEKISYLGCHSLSLQKPPEEKEEEEPEERTIEEILRERLEEQEEILEAIMQEKLEEQEERVYCSSTRGDGPEVDVCCSVSEKRGGKGMQRQKIKVI